MRTIKRKPKRTVIIISVLFASSILAFLGYHYGIKAETPFKMFPYTLDGQSYEGTYVDFLVNAMEWLRDETPSDATILCWWDYGHMVRGVAERRTVVYLPSEEIRHSIVDPTGITCYHDHSLIIDVCEALLTDEPLSCIEFMNQHDATYLLVVSVDLVKMRWMASFLDIDPSLLLTEGEVTETGKETLIYQALNNEILTGFEKVFSDEVSVIYKIRR